MAIQGKHNCGSSGLRAARLPALLTLPLWFAAACAVEPSEPSTGETLDHCVSNLDGDGAASCYATFTEAMAAATNGQITDAAANSADAFADGTLAERINALQTERAARFHADVLGTPGTGNTVIGIVNHDAHFQGKDWVFLVDRLAGCRTDANGVDVEGWAVLNLNTGPYTQSQMNDNISSFRTFGGCTTVLYEDWQLNNGLDADQTNKGRIASTGDVEYVGDAMNDKASSILWAGHARSL